VHAPFELWTYFQNAGTLLGSCAAAGNPTVTYTITDVFNNVIAQSPVGTGVQCTAATPLLVLDASDTSATADIGDLDLDRYKVVLNGYVGTSLTYPYSCPATVDHFTSQTGVAAPPFALDTSACQ
jgi:hypothetical protein